MKLTKNDSYKVEEIITSIYAGVAGKLDPTSEIYKEITKRLGSELLELRSTLGMVK